MVTSRIWFTAAQKAELWERWKNGQSAAAISRALERKNKTGVERIVVLHGGIGPAAAYTARPTGFAIYPVRGVFLGRVAGRVARRVPLLGGQPRAATLPPAIRPRIELALIYPDAA